jgi:hypothetical protein
MSTIIPVNSFELSIDKFEERIELVHLVLKINGFQYFRFPFYTINIENNLIDVFNHIIKGKEKTVDLNFNSNYNLIQFQKDTITIFLLNSVDTITQELKIVFENNSIVRNGLRKFIDNYKPICEETKNIIKNYIYIYGIYFPNTVNLGNYPSIKNYKDYYGKKHPKLDILVYRRAELFDK